MSEVGRFVQLKPKPAAATADCGADLSSVFAHTRSENDPVNSAERSNQRADVTDGLIAEYFDRETRVRILARQQVAKV